MSHIGRKNIFKEALSNFRRVAEPIYLFFWPKNDHGINVEQGTHTLQKVSNCQTKADKALSE